MKRSSAQTGRTMMEMLAVLSILGVLFAATMVFVNSMYDKYKSSTILLQIRDLRKNINNRYSAIGVYTGLNAKTLIDERLVPDQMVHGQKLIHPYQGEVKFSVGNTGGKNRSYKIIFPSLPYKNCVELATINWEVESTATLVGITINKTVYSWPVNTIGSDGINSGNTSTSLPMTFVKASKSCINGNNNEISWEFQ